MKQTPVADDSTAIFLRIQILSDRIRPNENRFPAGRWTVDGAGGFLANRGRKDMSALQQTRTELLAALAEVSRLRPEWRLGQLVANLATTAGRLDSGGVWELDDAEALAAAKMLIEQSSCADPEAEPQEPAAPTARR